MDARDSLGWHADDSPEMDPRRPIVTVSLGSEREILFRKRLGDAWSEVQRLSLANGSAAIMEPGMQQTWQHRIPKSSVSNIGPRISLTFRGYLPLN